MSLDPVVITSREVYDAVVRLTAAVERLADKHDGTSEKVRDHESRIRILERARWPLPSVSVVISLGALAAAVFIR